MICENCNKEHDGSYGSGRFCSIKCARSFSTKHENKHHTKEVVCSICGSINLINKRASSKNFICASCKGFNAKFCKICNKQLDYRNSSGFCATCSKKQSLTESHKEKLSKIMKERGYPRWNIHRNKKSYAEQFWTSVLDNNNIKYTFEYPVENTNQHYYFLDFYIEKYGYKIDLEIDGAQHEDLDRKRHDIIRDTYLNSIGYLVYRIKWNNINSTTGKLLMKEKIDNFLNFYNNL